MPYHKDVIITSTHEHRYINILLVGFGVKYRKHREINLPPNRPRQTIEIFRETLSRFSLAKAQTKALTDEITKMPLLMFFLTTSSMEKKLQKFENLPKNRL